MSGNCIDMKQNSFCMCVTNNLWYGAYYLQCQIGQNISVLV